MSASGSRREQELLLRFARLCFPASRRERARALVQEGVAWCRLSSTAELGTRLPVAFPIHPRTRERLRAAGLEAGLARAPGLRLFEPLGYREAIGLMAEARLVLTDSGGVQEETSHLGVPCLTLRPNTERPVTVTLGTNIVVGEETERVAPLVDELLAGRYRKGQPIPGWDGHAAERVAAALAERYAGHPSQKTGE